MIFSLQRRFFLLLLLPVALILIVAGVAGFLFTATNLFDQWLVSTGLRLEKAALEIRNQLTDKLELIDLIGQAEAIPHRDITQAFLIQELVEKNGVKFVDLDVGDDGSRGRDRFGTVASDYGPGVVEGLYTMELCEDVGFCAPIMDPGALDRSLRIVKALGKKEGSPDRRLIVRIGFDSFIQPLAQMGLLRGSKAILVTSSGQFLSVTDKSQSRRRRLGESGDKLEKEILDRIRKKPFGTVFGPGHPPKVVVAFHKVPMINWYLILYSEGNEILAPIVRFRLYYALAAITALLVILLLIRATTRSVGRSIAAISGAAARVREGDYSVELPEERADEIGALSRSFNDMIEGLKQRDIIQRTFGRYVDKRIAEELMSTPDAMRLGGEKRVVTVMMADMRNFTSVSEKMEPEEVINFLNRYFARMIDVVQRFDGIIVDFYGDSILVFFDGVSKDVDARAADAVKCAIDMQVEQAYFMTEVRAEGLPELKIGVGIHTGEVIVGNIGTATRAKYGVVGSNVNLVARIQATAAGGKTVISQDTLQRLSDRLTVSEKFSVCLKGVEGERELYEVDCMDGVCAIVP